MKAQLERISLAVSDPKSGVEMNRSPTGPQARHQIAENGDRIGHVFDDIPQADRIERFGAGGDFLQPLRGQAPAQLRQTPLRIVDRFGGHVDTVALELPGRDCEKIAGGATRVEHARASRQMERHQREAALVLQFRGPAASILQVLEMQCCVERVELIRARYVQNLRECAERAPADPVSLG